MVSGVSAYLRLERGVTQIVKVSEPDRETGRKIDVFGGKGSEFSDLSVTAGGFSHDYFFDPFYVTFRARYFPGEPGGLIAADDCLFERKG